MEILIGMDEAGYGPNFGPLVVAATAWQVRGEGSEVRGRSSGDGEAASASGKNGRKKPFGSTASARGGVAVRNPQSAIRNPQSDCPDLYRPLRNIVAKSASERRIAIADSKVLYTPGLGLRQLERGLHAVLLSMRQSLAWWSDMVQYCGADPDHHHKRVCCPDGFNCALPVDATIDELTRLEARFSRACDAAGIRPLFIRARLVFPAEFNDLVVYYGTKGGTLSHITVGLLREVMDTVRNSSIATWEGKAPAEPGTILESRLSRSFALPIPQPPATSPQPPIYALCDKHGGRNYYTALLQHHFSEHWIEPVFERHAESRYEWGPNESRIRVTFRMQGERFLPTALASMTAKYLRELAMRAFNEFWCARVPDLRPTAGYPKDSHRFRNAIAAAQRKLEIDDHVLWRSR